MTGGKSLFDLLFYASIAEQGVGTVLVASGRTSYHLRLFYFVGEMLA